MISGKALIIDLSSRQWRVEEIAEDTLYKYLGGRGLNAYLMWDWAKPPLNPLGPENRVIFSVGPVQGTGIVYETKCVVGTVSPLTNLYLFSVSGGQVGPSMGQAGYYALIFEGRADSPTYVWIDGDQVELRDARRLWGMKTREAQKAMLEEVEEEDAVTVVIGPAGERMVNMAAIMTEGDKQRSFGRGGAGAVMGSKNLKGFALKARRIRPIARPDKYLEAAKWVADAARKNSGWLKEWTAYGTRTGLEFLSAASVLPTRNFWTGSYAQAKDVTSYFQRDSKGRGVPCGAYCLTPCSAISQVTNGELAGQSCEGPEYETLFALGSNCVISDSAALIAAQRICDDWGLDTISVGVAISFAMECFQKGLLTKEDNDGLELRFGDARAMLTMIDRIAQRQGLGDLLGQGVRKAAEEIGRDSSFFAIHGKGLELGGYECRPYWGQAVQFAFSHRGGCHHDLGLPARAEMAMGTGKELPGKTDLVKSLAFESAIYDSSVLCTFSRRALGMETPRRLISAIGGRELSVDELKLIAERILTLERAIISRFGVRRKDDRLPERFTKEGYPDEPHKGSVVPLEELKDQFYNAMGWDIDTGVPTPEKLRELGLDYARLNG